MDERRKQQDRGGMMRISGVIEVKDGWIHLAGWRPKGMEKLKEVMGVEELEQEAVKEHVKTMSRDEAVKFFVDVGLPVAPVYWASEATKDPHIRARDMFVEIEHPKMGKYEAINFPVKLSETPGEVSSAAPLLGQNNKEILTNLLGYTEEQYEELRKNGVMAEGV